MRGLRRRGDSCGPLPAGNDSSPRSFAYQMTSSCVLLLAATAALLAAASIVAAPIRTVLDTDIGTDADDVFALLLILSQPHIYDVVLVQTSTYNTTTRARIVARILQRLGRLDVPIAVGRYTGDQAYPEQSIVDGYTMNDFVAAGGKVSYGTGALAALMGGATPSDPLVIIEIAPATSLGDVLAANASLSRNTMVVAMSGCIRVGYGNSTVCQPEYNVVQDIVASQRVYNATWLAPLVTAPLDTTIFMQFNGPLYHEFAVANASGRLRGVVELMAHYEAWYSGGGQAYSALLPFAPATGTSTMYDVQAAYMAGAYAGAWGGGAPPSFPNVNVEALHLAVNATGWVVEDAAAPLAYAATTFRLAGRASVDLIGSDYFGSVMGAGGRSGG